MCIITIKKNFILILTDILQSVVQYLSRIMVTLSFHWLSVLWTTVWWSNMSEALRFSFPALHCQWCQALLKHNLSSCSKAQRAGQLGSVWVYGCTVMVCVCVRTAVLPSSQPASDPFSPLNVPTRCKRPRCTDAAHRRLECFTH